MNKDSLKVGDLVFISNSSSRTDRCFVRIEKLNPKRFKGRHVAKNMDLTDDWLHDEVRDYPYAQIHPIDVADAEKMCTVVEKRIMELREMEDWLYNYIFTH